MFTHRVSLCQTQTLVARAAAAELFKIVASDKAPPEWVELIPPGVEIAAVDGRDFRNPSPQAVVDLFNADSVDLPIDYEHASEIKAPKGEPAPAAGWIVAMEVRDGGAIWGRVEWTPKGAASLTGREYRYISPAFSYSSEEGAIVQIVSAGLTNSPALRLAELAHAKNQGVEKMNPKILELLGLKEGATHEQIAEAIEVMKNRGVESAQALDAATQKVETAEQELATARSERDEAMNASPELSKFVPRKTYDNATARITELEQEAADRAKRDHEEKVAAALEGATQKRKITPAEVPYYTAQCSTAEGLKQFEEFVETKAPVVAADPVVDPKPAPTGGASKEPTDLELEVARNCGMTPEQLRLGK